MTSARPQWVYLDCHLFDHPKIMDLRSRKRYAAIVGYVDGLAYCTKHLTDGFIPDAWARTRVAPKDCNELVRVGLWHEVTDDPGPGRKPDPARCGYLVNDFLAYQISRDEWTAKGERLRERGRKGAAARWNQRSLRVVPDST